MSRGRLWYDPGPVVVAGLGLVLVAFHLDHALSADESLVSFVTGILIPLGLSLSIVYAGVRLRRSPLGSDQSLRVAVCALASATVLVFGLVLMTVYQTTHGVMIAEPFYILVGAASFGAPAGILIGVYNARLRREQDRTQEALDALTVFNRLLRHDLRNKMNVIRGRTGLLAEAVADGADADHTTKIDEVVDEVMAISDRSQHLETIVTGGSVSRQTVDLAVAVERAVADVRERHPNVQVDGPSLDSCPILAHPKLEVALVELLENAVLHGEERTPRVVVRGCADTDRAELRVADDGPGIPEAVLDTLDRGYETSLDHNTGLGLWLVTWVVDASNGTVEFSGSTDGTVVSLSFERPPDDRAGAQSVVSSPLSDARTASSVDD